MYVGLFRVAKIVRRYVGERRDVGDYHSPRCGSDEGTRVGSRVFPSVSFRHGAASHPASRAP